jgi:hypothetical protein
MSNTDLTIPDFLKREKFAAPPLREVSREVEQRREAHRIAMACRALLEKDRKRRARLRKRRAGP